MSATVWDPLDQGPYHWCNEHQSHATGPGVTTTRAATALSEGILAASPSFLDRLTRLVEAGILTPHDAKQQLTELGHRIGERGAR